MTRQEIEGRQERREVQVRRDYDLSYSSIGWCALSIKGEEEDKVKEGKKKEGMEKKKE
jgi:hypothetical protein